MAPPSPQYVLSAPEADNFVVIDPTDELYSLDDCMRPLTPRQDFGNHVIDMKDMRALGLTTCDYGMIEWRIRL